MAVRETKQDWEAVAEQNEVAITAARCQRATRNVCKGTWNVALLCGPPSVGKSHSIKIGVQHAGVNPIHAAPENWRELLEVFSEAREVRPIIFDEADHILDSPRMINILKIATDRKGHRTYPYKGRTLKLTAPVLIASNRDLNDGSLFEKAVRPHIAAIRSRRAPIVFPDSTTDAGRLALWEYACYLAVVHELLKARQDNNGYNSPALQNAALEWFTQHVWRMDDVSPRALLQIMAYIEAEPHQPSMWQSDCQSMLKVPAAEVVGKSTPPIPQIIVPLRPTVINPTTKTFQRKLRKGLVTLPSIPEAGAAA
jgi:hypothetical protein